MSKFIRGNTGNIILNSEIRSVYCSQGKYIVCILQDGDQYTLYEYKDEKERDIYLDQLFKELNSEEGI